MADRRKTGRKKTSDNEKLTKEEEAIARYVRFNCPTKTTMFEGNEVHYFTGTKAVDTLYESKKYGHISKNVKFATRQVAVVFMRSLLESGLFFRARKLVPKKKDDKKDQKEKMQNDTSKSPKKKLAKYDCDEEMKKLESDDNDEGNRKELDKKKEDDKKKKRKIKLELHQEQSFNDTNDVFVWIFDPTPLYKKVIGALMVLGTIASCLFPLWPMWLRQGVYYLSIAGLSCFGLLIGVAVARTVLFAIIWALTMGRHKLWLLPNLTEDCGFFESFQPWYTYEYCPTGSSKKKRGNNWKKKSDDDQLLIKKTVKGDDGDSSAAETARKTAEKSRKSEYEASGDSGHDDETDITDEEKTDGASESENGSSQVTNSSGNNFDNAESGDDADDAESHEVRLRQRTRKADEDFVLIDN